MLYASLFFSETYFDLFLKKHRDFFMQWGQHNWKKTVQMMSWNNSDFVWCICIPTFVTKSLQKGWESLFTIFCLLLVATSIILYFIWRVGDNFDKKSQLKKKRFFLHSIFSCYYCSRDLKRLSKHSGLVVIKLGLMVVIVELKYSEKKFIVQNVIIN